MRIDISFEFVNFDDMNCQGRVCKVPVGKTILVGPAACPKGSAIDYKLWVSEYKEIPNGASVIFTCQDNSKLTSLENNANDVQSIGCKDRKIVFFLKIQF